jgi:hypothetical protein
VGLGVFSANEATRKQAITDNRVAGYNVLDLGIILGTYALRRRKSWQLLTVGEKVQTVGIFVVIALSGRQAIMMRKRLLQARESFAMNVKPSGRNQIAARVFLCRIVVKPKREPKIRHNALR